MPRPRRQIQRLVPRRHFKRNHIPQINRHQVHRKKLQLPHRILQPPRPHDIARIRALPAKRSRLHLHPRKSPRMFHPYVISRRIPMRTRNRKPPFHRPRHKHQFRPLAPLLASRHRSAPHSRYAAPSHQLFTAQFIPPIKKAAPKDRQSQKPKKQLRTENR